VTCVGLSFTCWLRHLSLQCETPNGLKAGELHVYLRMITMAAATRRCRRTRQIPQENCDNAARVVLLIGKGDDDEGQGQVRRE
jgi:hypothetical protein